MHKCPTEPCEDCWEEARVVGFILVIFGLFVAAMLYGCVSIQTTDCKRDDAGMWRCERRN